MGRDISKRVVFRVEGEDVDLAKFDAELDKALEECCKKELRKLLEKKKVIASLESCRMWLEGTRNSGMSFTKRNFIWK